MVVAAAFRRSTVPAYPIPRLSIIKVAAASVIRKSVFLMTETIAHHIDTHAHTDIVQLFWQKRKFTAKVVSFKVASMKLVMNGKTELMNGYEVVLDDTILFPEGGGQPDDRGTIENVTVHKVWRRGAEAVHFVTTAPPNVGTAVTVTVDWTRRFDHMQQHSGQHLITAIAESIYGFKTTSWNLGEKVSFIELDTSSVTAEQMDEIERVTNEKIREHLPVNVRVYEEGSKDLQDVRSRVLPDDHVGLVRVVSIEGIDDNACCGTHISNLSHLQVIKLLYVEKGKKNKSNVFFIVGDRVLRYTSECVQKDKIFTTYLKGGPDSHVQLLDKMQKALKIATKNELTLVRDLAMLEADRFKEIQPKPCFFSLHRKEGNSDFMSIILKEINDEDVLIFLTVGDDKGAGQLLLSGKPELVQDLGPKIMEVLDGKGSGKGNRFNGKVNNLSLRSKAESILKEAVGFKDN